MARTQDGWGAEGISGRVKFLPLAWAGMPKTSFRKNSDSPKNIFDPYATAHSGYSSSSIKSWGETVQVLTVNTTPSSVPVPGAVWLFGTAMAGLVIRRKSVI